MQSSSTKSTSSTGSAAPLVVQRRIGRLATALFLLAAVGNATRLVDPMRLLRTLPDLCPVHRLFGFDCPGCGMGRALVHLAKGELTAGVEMHPFAPILLTITVASALLPSRSLEAVAQHRLLGTILPALFVGAVVAWWLLTKVA
jgi:hypothetical protein